MALPAEICGMICQDPQLTRRDLRVLCAVSRTFRDEAERILRTVVRLPNLRLILSWSRSLVRRPHLALPVRSLSLTFPSPTSFYPAELIKVHRSLRACSNLQTLEVLNDGKVLHDEKTDSRGSCQGWVLEGHSFRLSKFTNTYFDQFYLFRFLDQQSDIHTLVSPTWKAENVPHSILPNLCTIHVSSNALGQLASWSSERKRPIAHVQYDLSHSSSEYHQISTFVALGRFRETLTNLSLRRCGGLSLTATMATVAVQLPGLKFFRFLDEGPVSYTAVRFRLWTHSRTFLLPQRLSFFDPILSSVLLFNSIETMILQAVLFRGSEPPLNMFRELNSHIGRLDTAIGIMESCSTLLRLVFISDNNYAFTRSEDGDVRDEGVVELDDSAWMHS